MRLLYVSRNLVFFEHKKPWRLNSFNALRYHLPYPDGEICMVANVRWLPILWVSGQEVLQWCSALLGGARVTTPISQSADWHSHAEYEMANVCKFYLQGKCMYGNRCKKLHPQHRPKYTDSDRKGNWERPPSKYENGVFKE